MIGVYAKIFDTTAVVSLAIIISIIGWTLYSNCRQGKVYEIFKPSTFVCLVCGYYGIVAPFNSILEHDYTYRSVSMIPFYSVSWLAMAVMLVGFKVSTIINFPRKPRPYWDYTTESIQKASFWLYFIGFCMYVLWMGSNITILIHGYTEGNEFRNEGTFVMYLMQGVAFFTLPCCCLLWLNIKYKYNLKPWGWFLCILSLWIYINSGFRFRLVFFAVAFGTVYYVTKIKRPNFLYLGIFALAFILFMGVMEYGRSYEKGVDFSRVSGTSSEELFNGGTNEGRIFMASGVCIAIAEKRGKYAYFDPIMNAVLMPLPYAFFPEKRSYIGYMDGLIDPVFKEHAVGIAVLEYAEAFVAAGWIGVFVLGLFMGFVCKRVWLYFIHAPTKFMPIMTMALFNGFIYIWISRGYLAQIVVTAFFYVIIPLWIIRKLTTKYNRISV